ncbi:MAG: BamA/TamA family outer membrane protein [Tannerella sp.]|jgi:outer membrane protein assembly factor BamA|nr:BamA/TamA family outer membrane protein [Tannerella sp.]
MKLKNKQQTIRSKSRVPASPLFSGEGAMPGAGRMGRAAGGRAACLLCTVYCALCVAFGTSCSTTKNLPAGEQLYTGIQNIEAPDANTFDSDGEAMAEIEGSLACPPNNALFGSSSVRIPVPLRLWIYNALVNKEGGFNRWLFKMFAAKPVLVSTVNPEIRTKIAQQLLYEHGYFNGTASCQVIPHANDSLKAKIRYKITMNEPYTYDSIEYRQMQHYADTLLKLSESDRLLRKGDKFNVILLEAERQRIASLMRNNGYYYFRPDYIVFEADSTLSPQKVSLRIKLKEDLSPMVRSQWKTGLTSFHLYGYDGEAPTDSLQYRDLKIYYEGRLRIKPKELYRRLKFRRGDLYSQAQQEQTQSELNRLGVFKYTEMQYTPSSNSERNDTLNMNINATCDLPLNGELEANFTANSNRRIGPGAVFSLTKNNLFRRGERLNIRLNGSHEWLIGRKQNVSGSLRDNYEYGITGTLTYPRVMLPGFFRREYDFPASTTLQLYANRLSRSDFFRILSFGSSATYDFVPDPIRTHAFIPFSLTFNLLENTTARFDSIAANNNALYQSLRNQFIPSISYTYTLDNLPVRRGRHTTWWQLSVTESGNIISGIYALAGKRFNEHKTLFGNPFSQFLKLTTELRYNHVLNRNSRLVSRLAGGVIYSYGSSSFAPYSEQFYVGGANSIRAFTIRTIGPGRFKADDGTRFANLDHVGDLKLEGNLEYRFNLVGDLEGAVFLDAGNVWLLRNDRENSRSGGKLEWRHLLNDIALGTGCGFRYNLTVLVIRLDLGLALHVPYDTGKRGYFNKTRHEGIGFHIAVGYPF